MEIEIYTAQLSDKSEVWNLTIKSSRAGITLHCVDERGAFELEQALLAHTTDFKS